MKTAAKDTNKKIIQLQETACSLAGNVCGPWLVSKEQQQKELAILKRLIVYEHFFFVTDLRNYAMAHSGGIERWLGYNENKFSMNDYFRIHHPSSLDVSLLKTSVWYELICIGKLKTGFMKNSFTMRHALRHANGNYIWVKLTGMPFQMNKNGQVTECLNSFIIIGPYTNATGITGFVNTDDEYDAAILPPLRTRSREILPFSVKEYDALKMMAENPCAVADEIAALLSIEKSTLNTYKKRLLLKAREYTRLHFEEAVEVALFFKQQGML